MKIGFVLDDSLDGNDGVQQYVLTLGQWLAKQGHSVHYLVGATSRTDVANIHPLSHNVKVRFNGNRLSIPLPASRNAIKLLLQQEQFDVLHIQMPYSPFLAGRIIMAAPAATRLVGTFHIFPQSGVVRLASRLLAVYEWRSLRRFQTVVAVSSAAQAFAAHTFGLQTTVVPNVVDTGRFAAGRPRPDIAHDGPVIVSLGRLVPRKGCRVLLEAFVKLRENPKFHTARLVICGKGPLEAELKQFTVQHSLDGAVTFTGFVTEADKPDYLASADLAVFPSSGGESFGIVLVEAMAANRPVVLGAANEGYRTVLQAGPDMLFAPNDPAALTALMTHYLEDATAQAAALAWQRTTVGQYDVATVGRHLLQCYEAEADSDKLHLKP